MNDTIQYGFYKTQSNESYKPFQSKEFNYNDKKDKNDNFCPICRYNYNSHYHKKHCNVNPTPIGDGLFILLFMTLFYGIYRNLKKK
jgi:hypothetical protein